MHQSKILVTLGPSSSSADVIRQLLLAGADAVRLNFSHGTHEEHAARVESVRAVSKSLGREVAILGDLCGPKLRVGTFSNQQVLLAEGDLFTLTTRSVQGDQQQVSISYPLQKDLSRGDRLLLDDGLIAMQVEQVLQDGVCCRVITGGVLSDKKGVNVPSVRLSIPAITEKDEQDISFGRQVGVDWFALSFVRDANEVLRCKELAGEVPVVAKLEKPEAMAHLESIVDAADGIMVARGDLGVEMGPERVPVAQKRAIDWANHQGKLVITATQMLDSMMHQPRPTRAEASDVANAIFDGSDVVMLSGETAAGKYPVESVRMMHAIIQEVEQSEKYRSLPAPSVYTTTWESENATARAAATLSRHVKLAALVVVAKTSEWLDLLADYRPNAPILALVDDARLARRVALQWGIISRVIETPSSQAALIEVAEAAARQMASASTGDDLAILAPCLPHGCGRSLILWKLAAGR